MTKLAEKLARRIKEEFDMDVDPIIKRTRAGYWQRGMGAWSWSMRKGSSVGCVASQYTAKEIAAAKTWEYIIDGLDIVLFPGTKNDA